MDKEKPLLLEYVKCANKMFINEQQITNNE